MKDDEYMRKALAGDFKMSFTEMLLHTLQLLKEQNPLSHIYTSNEVMERLIEDGFIVWENPNIALTEKGKELVARIEIDPTISTTYRARME